jgi:hypothetical protein
MGAPGYGVRASGLKPAPRPHQCGTNARYRTRRFGVPASAGLTALLAAQAQASTTCEFQFYDNPPTGSPTVVGTGTLTFDNYLADGTHAFMDLDNVKPTFSINGLTFTEADIVESTKSLTDVVLSTTGLNLFGPFRAASLQYSTLKNLRWFRGWVLLR